MGHSFLTIFEATKRTGRSLSTIRRLIHVITEDPKHPDRNSIEPTVAAVQALRKKGENFAWRIREDVLMKYFAGALGEEKKSDSPMTGDMLSIIQRELDLKNQQIEKQWEVIASLNERLREGNILMGSLQKRLSLPQAQSPVERVVDAATVSPTPKKTAHARRSKVGVGGKKPTKSWLLRWMKR